MDGSRQERMLEIFFHALRGGELHVGKLAREYGVSTKSISRNICDLKTFLADHRALVSGAELQYNYKDRCYRLHMDDFFSVEELFAILETLVGARAFSKTELLGLFDKIKKFATAPDRKKIEELLRKEMFHYAEVHHDCDRILPLLWQVANCIEMKREITIEYYRMDRVRVTHRLAPVSVMFTDYYFYLIAFKAGETAGTPLYFRIDRIKRMIEHRSSSSATRFEFDEGLLRRRSPSMWPGKLRKIVFEFSGPSVQAVLDKLPTAKIVGRQNSGHYLIEAEVYGDGIRMWLLSQGSWARVIAPEEFVEEIRLELARMQKLYDEPEGGNQP